MMSTEKKILSKQEKQRLGFKILSQIVFKPLGLGLFFTILFLIFIPFDPLIPDIYDYRPVNSFDKYFTQVLHSLKVLPKFFLVIVIFAFLYYLFRKFRLILDLVMDYFSLEKTLGKFTITEKKKFLNTYYLKTTDPNFSKIKTNREILEKINTENEVALVVARSGRVYRYNAIFNDFRIDKLL